MPAPQKVTCPKCVELWREYAEATRFHVQLLKELELREASDTAQELAPEVGLAGVRRDSARAGIRIHLAMDHANEPSRHLAVG